MSSEEMENIVQSRSTHHADSEQQAKRRSFARLKSNKDVDDLLDQIADAANTDDEEDNQLKPRAPAAVMGM